MTTVVLPQIHITKKALKQMRYISRQKKAKETGGMILGYVHEYDTHKTILIQKVTGPGANATLEKYSFQPDIEYYRRMRKRYSQMEYLGEWHKHPTGYDVYSQHDLIQAKSILKDEQMKEIVCPICYRINGQWQISFFYLNSELERFVRLSYTVIDDSNRNECKTVIIEKNILKAFLRKNKNIMAYRGDLYPGDGIFHLFSRIYRGNSQVYLVNATQKREFDLPVGLNITVYKDGNGEIYAKSFQVGKEKNPLKVNTQIIDPQQDIFSRNKGILETTILENKHVAVIGCGSIGSVAALELARSGVKEFTLIDSDKVSIENLCRHACDLSDLGFAKVNAVEKHIFRIMPSAKIHKHHIDFNEKPQQSLQICQKADVLLVATDTENSRHLANWISHKCNIPVIYAGLLERATGGRIWRTLPQKTACYQCHAQIAEVETKNVIPYSQLESLKDLTIQPGLGNDIAFITHLAVRYVMDSLLEPNNEKLSQIPYNVIFWFNRKHKDWNNKDLTIYHIDELPINTKCSFCSSTIKEK